MTTNLDEIVSQIKSGNLKIFDFLAKPQKYQTMGGQDIFGYPPDEFYKAVLYYTEFTRNLAFDKAEVLLQHMKVTVAIEELALLFNKALFKNIEQISFLQGLTDIKTIITVLYCKFLDQTPAMIKQLLDQKTAIYEKIWLEIVHDEDAVTPEQLGCFYNSLPLPVCCFFTDCVENNLATAYRTLPLLLAKTQNYKRVFDFGGNSGVIISVMANSMEMDECLLIEENELLLNFAKWRDELFGVKKVNYKKEREIAREIDSMAGSYEMGICMDVLEHVFDVEETLTLMAKLLKKDGLLYQSTSFGLYPIPSHLKKNLKYAGQEDGLMANFGFERVGFQTPIPLVNDVKVYRKL
jgi:2-polyprenyl-3-methyl-5-hydroxy-6-metoxy-1,4-benzoquinol methylase